MSANDDAAPRSHVGPRRSWAASPAHISLTCVAGWLQARTELQQLQHTVQSQVHGDVARLEEENSALGAQLRKANSAAAAAREGAVAEARKERAMATASLNTQLGKARGELQTLAEVGLTIVALPEIDCRGRGAVG